MKLAILQLAESLMCILDNGPFCVWERVPGQGDAVPPFRTRREPVHGGSDETSLFHTVLMGGTTPPRLCKCRAEFQKPLIFGVCSKRTFPAMERGVTPGTVRDRKSRTSPHGWVHGVSRE